MLHFQKPPGYSLIDDSIAKAQALLANLVAARADALLLTAQLFPYATECGVHTTDNICSGSYLGECRECSMAPVHDGAPVVAHIAPTPTRNTPCVCCMSYPPNAHTHTGE